MSSSLSSLEASTTPITIQGFIHTQRIKPRFSFLVIRQGTDTIQCIYDSSHPDFKTYNSVTVESFVEIRGVAVLAKVNSCTVTNIEIQVEKITVIGQAETVPFSVRDASLSEPERTKLAVPDISLSKLLDNRSLHLRTFHCQSIFRIESAIMQYTREFLNKLNFTEIKTSKLIEASSEGGANLFSVNYFKTTAFLAQSPQLYKQMAVIGGFEKVYEMGHVYRAEESNTNRYLSEFIGVDLELQITDVKTLVELIWSMINNMVKRVYDEKKTEIECIRKFNPFEDLIMPDSPVVIDYQSCVQLLNENEVEFLDGNDFNRENEKLLGALIKKQFNTDVFVIVGYPAKVRAFYTKKCSEGVYSNSFDFVMRGEEILSGAERENILSDLIRSIEEHRIDPESLKGYLTAFKYGVPKHGGCGIGFERLMKQIFGFKDIRYFNMFPREPSRLYP